MKYWYWNIKCDLIFKEINEVFLLNRLKIIDNL